MQVMLVLFILILVFLMPVLMVVGAITPSDKAAWPIGAFIHLGINTILLLSLAITEFGSMTIAAKNITALSSRDHGYLSAILTVLAVIYLPLLDRYVVGAFVIDRYTEYLYMAGVTIFVAGFMLRRLAVLSLGKYFSHELRILKTQHIIKTGVYKYVRHPAYSGTILIIIGASWMFLSNIGVILAIFGICLALIRIKHEEAMLSKAFADEYAQYTRKTKKLIPFVI